MARDRLSRRSIGVLAASVFLLAFGLYLLTLAPTITWRFSGSDSGDLASAAFSWGIPHPTGYPLWTLLGFLITRLPFGDPALGTNCLSALSGAGAAVFVALTTLRLSNLTARRASNGVRLLAAGGAGLAFATAPAFWSQSILTEVYSLNALLIAIICWLVATEAVGSRQWAVGGRGPGPTANYPLPTALLAFACGLALTNHSTAVFAVVAAAVATAMRLWGVRPRWRILLRDLLLFLTPLLLYLLIPWRASMHPAENWNDPQTLGRFVQAITGAQYHSLLAWQNPIGALHSLPAIVRLFLSQYAWWGLPLAIYGLLSIWEVERPFALFSLLMLVAYIAFTSVYRAEGAEYYLLPAYLVEAVLLGVGLTGLGNDLAPWVSEHTLPGVTPAVLMAALVLVSIVPFTAVNFHSHNLRHDHAAYAYAHAALAAATPGATLRTNSDDQTFSLWYLQKVVGFRRDVHIVDTRLEAAGIRTN